MEAAAANVITDAVRTYARKRARTTMAKKPKFRRFRGVMSALPRTWQFQRMVSTGQSGVALTVATDATGATIFKSLTTTSPSITFDFALDAMRVYLGGINIMAVAVPGYNELTALFDSYRFEKIELFYTCSMAANNSVGTAQQFYFPGVAYVVDTDDANPATATDLQQYANCKYTQFGGISNTTMKRLAVFTPKCQSALYTSGTVVAGQGQTNVWLDAASADVRHYGFKMAIDQLVASTSTNQNWFGLQFQVRYHLSMKDLR